MELSSYYASILGWVTTHDYFIGGISITLCTFLVVSLPPLVLEAFQAYNARKRREMICLLQHSRQASEPCHVRSCPASGCCCYYKPLSFKDRILRAFGVKKKKP